MANNNGLLNQIPQAVSQAIQPIVQEASTNITGSINNVLGINGASPSPTSPNTSNPSSNINARPSVQPSIQPRPWTGVWENQDGPTGNAPYTGMIFDQFRKPGDFGRYISPSEMQARDPSYAYSPPSQLFAGGGMARQANNLASRGRGGDTMLVHMTPDEVSGLQALAMAQGGSLTINPDTGLPEASFLSDTFKAIAPTLIGAGLTYFTGGVINPWMAGALVGGVEAARTKDLGRGLLAGLGAYGGAGMGQAFAGMGAAAPATATGTGTKALGEPAFGDITKQLAGASTNDTVIAGAKVGSAGIGESAKVGNVFGRSTLSGGGVENFVDPAGVRTGLGTATGPYSSSFAYNPNFVADPSSVMSFDTASNVVKPSIDTAVQGFNPNVASEVVKTPTAEIVDHSFTKLEPYAGPDKFKEFGNRYVQAMEGPTLPFMDNPLWSGETGTKAAVLGTLGNVAYRAGAFEQPGMETPEEYKSDYAGPYVAADRTYLPQSRESILGGEGREHQYYDVVNPVPGYRTMNAARGGLLALNKMAAGRYLKGAGDGTSDSIPATIGQNQPARLADGEFVVDARTVSELGNGSSDAGARKLYAMMDNVHNARRNAERGKPSGADQYLKGLTATA